MPEVPFGLSFDQSDDGFILRRKNADGNIVAITISRDELFGLKATMSLWSDRMIQASQAESGSVHALVAHPIARVRLIADAVRENILATVEAPSGEQMTLSLSKPVAEYIATELPAVLASLRADRPLKQ
jgi:hypothetical protein